VRVGAPRSKTAPGALRCLYCGVARKAAGAPCAGCGAEPPSVPCGACGRPVDAPHTHCACGAPCIAWSKHPGDGLPCPRCQGPIWRVQLDVTAVHVEQCSRCLGCFARTGDFSELLAREEAGGEMALRRFVPVAAGRELPRQTLLAPVKCPHCRREMDRVRFAQRASLIVDVCPAHGMWLDAGELVAVLEFIKHRSEGEVAPGQAELEDEAKWNRISVLRAEEERVVDRYASRAENMMGGGSQGVSAGAIAAAAVGGPWLGLFVALRGKKRR
jgi:Zn-finger nucleic acid-binding protein